MKRPDFNKLFEGLKMTASKRSPELLVGFGVAGMTTALILMVPATIKSVRKVDKIKPKTKREIVKITWKYYAPSAGLFLTSAACIIGGSTINYKRNAALATAYKLSETAFNDYREKVIQTVGEKKDKEVRESVAADKVKERSANEGSVIMTGKGQTLFLEPITGQMFRSDINKIDRILNTLNRRMRSEMYISLSDYLYELGLRQTLAGSELGWRIDDGDIEYTPIAKLTEDMEPCIYLEYTVGPRPGYSSLY